MTPGIVHDLSIEAYHSGHGISKSGLDDIARSPAIYYARHLDPKRPPAPQRAGQIEGNLAHCAILEPEEFGKRYVVGPDLNRNTKAWKEFVESLDPAMTPIKAEQYTTAMRQAESVRSLPEVAQALALGRPEVSAFWIDEITGELCRCRPDWVHDCGDAGVILLDVKTYGDASPAEFARQVARKRYFVQDAFYSDGFHIASGREVLAFVFVTVETEYPHLSSATVLDDPAREHGRHLYRRDLDRYAACRSTGLWPGYSDDIQIINLPAWAYSETA